MSLIINPSRTPEFEIVIVAARPEASLVPGAGTGRSQWDLTPGYDPLGMALEVTPKNV